MPIEDARIEELIDAAAALTSILADRGFDPRERRVILSLAAIQEAKRLGWRKAAIADSLNRLCDLCRIEGGHPVSWISLAARRAHASFRSRRYQPPARERTSRRFGAGTSARSTSAVGKQCAISSPIPWPRRGRIVVARRSMQHQQGR